MAAIMGFACAAMLILLAAGAADAQMVAPQTTKNYNSAQGMHRWQCITPFQLNVTPAADPMFRGVVFRLPLGGSPDPECASLDGKTCYRDARNREDDCLPWWGQPLGPLEKAGKMKPVRCGAAHAAAWGSGNTGYNQGPRHWCNVAKAILAKQAAAYAAYRGPAGAPCTANTNCASNVCHFTPAVEVASATGAKLGLCGCKDDAGCNLGMPGKAVGTRCVKNQCVLLGEGGAACSAAQDCLSGACAGGKCACKEDVHCAAGSWCAQPGSGAGCAPHKLFNAACKVGRECGTGRCLGGVCKDCETDAHCLAINNVGSEPKQGVCNKATKACKQIEDTRAGCKSDGDCDYAVTFHHCRKAVDPKDSVCLIRTPAMRCTSNRQCGVPRSEAGPARDGACVAGRCHTCARPQLLAAWYPGELSLSADYVYLARYCQMNKGTWEWPETLP